MKKATLSKIIGYKSRKNKKRNMGGVKMVAVKPIMATQPLYGKDAEKVINEVMKPVSKKMIDRLNKIEEIYEDMIRS